MVVALLHTGYEIRICLFCLRNDCVGQVICLYSHLCNIVLIGLMVKRTKQHTNELPPS